MYRRLYFLFPDEVHARHAIDNLMDGAGVEGRFIHAVANDERKLRRLPRTTRRQKADTLGRVERTLWGGNLGLFGLGVAGVFTGLFRRSGGWALAGVLVMAATFLAGLLFSTRLPHTRIADFRGALARGEILVMVDVPPRQVVQVEEFMHHRYPESEPGGASWAVERFGL